MISIISGLVRDESGTSCYHHESTIPISTKPHLLYRSQECPSGRTSSTKILPKVSLCQRLLFSKSTLLLRDSLVFRSVKWEDSWQRMTNTFCDMSRARSSSESSFSPSKATDGPSRSKKGNSNSFGKNPDYSQSMIALILRDLGSTMTFGWDRSL